MIVLLTKRVDIYKNIQDFDKLHRALEEFEAFVKELKIPSFDLQAKLLNLVKIEIDDSQTEEQEQLDDVVTQILSPFAKSELPLSLD